MSTSLFGLGSSINVNAAGTLVPQSFVGAGGQVLFNITAFTYTPGTNSLLVFINGQRQILGRDFAETSSSSFTLVEGVVAGDFVDIIGFPLSSITQVLAGGIPYQWAGPGGTLQTVDSRLQEESVFLFDILTAAEIADAKTGSPTIDVSAKINAALASAITLIINAGANILTRFPINLSARRDNSGSGLYGARRLIGQGGSAKCIINGYTGVYPIVDLTGSSNCAVEGINFRSDNPGAFGLAASACASIGIFNCRGSVVPFNTSCSSNRYSDLRLNMTSDMARNSGRGTIGFLNIAGEHLCNIAPTQIYANLPFVSWNTAQVAISHSSDIPVLGVNYEPVYTGGPVSNTIHYFSNMILVAYDSFRAIELQQDACITFPNLYTSTRKLISLVPAFTETILMTDCAAVTITECYQETSGLFGATYRMDHAYCTFAGLNENINIRIQRAVNDAGFTIPGAAVESIKMLASAYLANSDINCNYTIGTYNNSGDNNGFAALPVTVVGVLCQIKNVKFTLDHSGSHSADIYSVIGPYCVNVDSINYFSADNYFGASDGVFTPVVIGTTVPGVGTYTLQAGTYAKAGRIINFTIDLGWSAHTGTGFINIGGLPFPVGATVATFAMYSDGYLMGAGKILQAIIPGGATAMFLASADQAGGAATNNGIDTVVARLVISGSYRMAGSL